MEGFMLLNASNGVVLVHDCTPEFSFPEDPLAMVMRMSGPLFAFHQISKDVIDDPENRASFSAFLTDKCTLHIGYTFISQVIVIAVIFLHSQVFGTEKELHNTIGENLANICCTTFSSSIQEVKEPLPKRTASEFCTEFAEACKTFIPRFVCEKMAREMLRTLKVQPNWIYMLQFNEEVSTPKPSKKGLFSQFFKNKKKEPDTDNKKDKRSTLQVIYEFINVFSTMERPATRTARLQSLVDKIENNLTHQKDVDAISVVLADYQPVISEFHNTAMIFCYKKLIVCFPYVNKDTPQPEMEEQVVVMVQKWIAASYQFFL